MINRVIFNRTHSYRESSNLAMRATETLSHYAENEMYMMPGSFACAYSLPPAKASGSSKLRKVEAEEMGVDPETEFQKPVILHVEDNPEIRFLVKMLLRKDYEVISVETGETAIERAEKGDFDIILMDINLGSGLSGIDTSRKLRELNGFSDVPIIAVTAINYHEVRNECIEAGMNAYIQKPFDKADLIQTIKQLNGKFLVKGVN